MAALVSATGVHRIPAIAGVRATITEQAPSMATFLEELNPEIAVSSPHPHRGFAIPPAVEPTIVDRVPVVDPQLGSVIGNEREPVNACSVEADTGSPAHSEVGGTTESRPAATCVAVVDYAPPPRHLGPPVEKILAMAAL